MNIHDFNLDGYPISTNSFSNTSCRKNIRVLLVEHDTRDHDTIMNMLNYFSYKAASVKLASTAISIISKGNVGFDFVVANINSPDSLAFQLLQEATKINLAVIFMSNVDDEARAKMAVEEGALLCVTKSMIMGVLGCLWQFLLVRKAHLNKGKPTEEKEIRKYVVESNPNIKSNSEENRKSMNISNSRDDHTIRSSRYGGAGLKRKGWTIELHEKFMAAVKQLGQGKCYPKDVLELMNVPGLTRMQVASHLQKCRNGSWVPRNERKIIKVETPPRRVSKSPGAGARSRAKTLRFGLMPEDRASYQTATTDSCGESSNRCYLMDHDGFDNNEEFVYCDPLSFSSAANTNISEGTFKFDTLPVSHSSTLYGFPEQEPEPLPLDMDDFNGAWQSLFLQGQKHDQVGDASNDGFGEAAVIHGHDLEKDGCE